MNLKNNRGCQYSAVYNMETSEFMKLEASYSTFRKFNEYGYVNNNCRNRCDCPKYIAQPFNEKPRIWNGETGDLVADPGVIDIPGFDIDSIRWRGSDHDINLIFDKWRSLRGNREELKRVKDHYFIMEGVWLVSIEDDSEEVDLGHPYIWMLYHEVERKFTLTPLSDYPYGFSCTRLRWAAPDLNKSELDRFGISRLSGFRPGNNVQRPPPENRVKSVYPWRKHWIIHKYVNNKNIFTVWDYRRNQYQKEPILLLDDIYYIEPCGKCLIVSCKSNKSLYIINQDNLQISVLLGESDIMGMASTPEGNPILWNNRYNNKEANVERDSHKISEWCNSVIKVKCDTGEISEVSIKTDCVVFRSIVGIPNENSAFLIEQTGIDAKHFIISNDRMTKINFIEKTYEQVFPRD